MTATIPGPSGFEAMVRELAGRLDERALTVTVLPRRARRPASAHLGRWEIRVEELRLQEMPHEAQRLIAAHEYAHLHLGHKGTRSKARLLAAWAAIAVATGLALVASSGTGSGPLLEAISAAGVTALALYARAIRPLEVEADRQAMLWVGPMPGSVVDALSRAEGIVAARLPSWLRTHPTPRDRQRLSATPTP